MEYDLSGDKFRVLIRQGAGDLCPVRNLLPILFGPFGLSVSSGPKWGQRLRQLTIPTTKSKSLSFCCRRGLKSALFPNTWHIFKVWYSLDVWAEMFRCHVQQRATQSPTLGVFLRSLPGMLWACSKKLGTALFREKSRIHLDAPWDCYRNLWDSSHPKVSKCFQPEDPAMRPVEFSRMSIGALVVIDVHAKVALMSQTKTFPGCYSVTNWQTHGMTQGRFEGSKSLYNLYGV